MIKNIFYYTFGISLSIIVSLLFIPVYLFLIGKYLFRKKHWENLYE